jgi:adenine-specific DNA methylase
MDTIDQRLIERGFPCHQVGAETQRERGMSTALPAHFALHVWWARRPLTPSRAAIVASLDGADTDPEIFIRQLGIERVQALVQGKPWTLDGALRARVRHEASGQSLHGRWTDRLYGIVAVRLEPVLDQRGQPLRYTSGPVAGELKTRKVRFFRSPHDRDLQALEEAEKWLQQK